jgi:hypothetical protein
MKGKHPKRSSSSFLLDTRPSYHQVRYSTTVEFVLQSSACNGHLSYAASLFLTLCNTFPIKINCPKMATSIGPQGDCLWQTWLDRQIGTVFPPCIHEWMNEWMSIYKVQNNFHDRWHVHSANNQHTNAADISNCTTPRLTYWRNGSCASV